MVDWRLPRPAERKQVPRLNDEGKPVLKADGSREMIEILEGGDTGLYLRGSRKAELNIWCQPQGSGELTNYRRDTKLPAALRAASVPKVRADRAPGEWNRFLITVRGKTVTVVLNGQEVIAPVELPDLPARGPIALQYHGDPIEFANLFVKELP
jgi:hypothetical protein